jgi:hypothetical protein
VPSDLLAGSVVVDDLECSLVAEDRQDISWGAIGFMNWTSTQHPGWAEQFREFASKRVPFRVDHVAGQKEEEVCDNLCAEHHFLQERRGSSVLFIPIPS